MSEATVDDVDLFVTHQIIVVGRVGVQGCECRTDEFVAMARRLDEFDELAALELNVSCPNVTGGVDYGTDPAKTEAVVRVEGDLPQLPDDSPELRRPLAGVRRPGKTW